MRSNPPGRAAERRTLDRTGFSPTKASGALAEKGDGRDGNLRLEVKSTTGRQFGLKLSWLQKIAREALQAGARPVMSLVFCTEDGRPRRDGAWVMIREQDWEEVRHALAVDVQEQPARKG